MRQAFAEGIAWGEAKQALFERIDGEVAPLRENYEALIAQSGRDRGDPARRRAAPARAPRHADAGALREAVGLRDLSQVAASGGAKKDESRAADVQAVSRRRRPVLLQARRWRPRAGAERRLRVAKDAGQLIARLKQEGGAALHHVGSRRCTWATN